MKRIFLIVLVFVATKSLTFSQQISINGSIGNRPLVWSDFTGVPDQSSPYYAYTYWNIRYKFSGAEFKDDTAILKGFSASLELDPQKSWLKKEFESDRLLIHEQGHFDIGRLCFYEFLNTTNHTVFFRSNYREKLQTLFMQILNKYKEMSSKYDEETEHSNKSKKQQEWISFLQNELKRMESEAKVVAEIK